MADYTVSRLSQQEDSLEHLVVQPLQVLSIHLAHYLLAAAGNQTLPQLPVRVVLGRVKGLIHVPEAVHASLVHLTAVTAVHGSTAEQ